MRIVSQDAIDPRGAHRVQGIGFAIASSCLLWALIVAAAGGVAQLIG